MNNRTRNTKKWGRITAAPNEFLIHMRRGRIVRSGAGLSIFAWPSDSWTIVPTSIQRVTFTADQVTAEKVGVEVRGIAVFRIADPILAFRVLDVGDHDPMESVANILRDMFVGAARRLVANMTIEACLTRRKEEIATELIREIRPVVSGIGRPDDATDRGWGLVVDTLEIHDVRILSEAVFENLQAPYRASIEMTAQQSRVDRDREVHLREVESNHKRLEADQVLAKRRHEVEEVGRLASIARDEKVRLAEVEAEQRVADQEHSLAEQQLQAELALLERTLELKRKRGELEAELAKLHAEIANLVSDERIRLTYVQDVLPELAAAIVGSTAAVNVTQVSTGDATADALGGVLAQLGTLLAKR